MQLTEYKDMFGLYYRVKEIRPTYSLWLNRKTNKVELHDSNSRAASLVFDLPLMPNAIKKIESSMVEKSAKIFRSLEEENCKNEQKNIENAIYFAKNQLNK